MRININTKEQCGRRIHVAHCPQESTTERDMHMNKLFTPLQIGPLSLKNRIVFAPTSMGRSGIDAYETIAAGGVGLLVLADLSVTESMLGGPSLDSMEDERWFRQVIAACHKHGCKVSAQLFHPEYDVSYMKKLYEEAVRGGKITPEDARNELARSTGEYCDLLTEEEIETIIRAFGEAAKRAEEIGFDMVQIHGDRLLGSFASPLFNHRNDRYGNHMEVPARAAQAVREAVSSIPVDYKLTIRLDQEKLGRGGISMEEVPEAVARLNACGVDSYHVTLANHTDIEDTIPVRNHPKLPGEGCFAGLAEEVKKYTEKPVCAVGKIQTPAKAEEILSGTVDMIAMSRQLVADPMWPKKVEEGRDGEILYCLYCNKQCVQSLKGGQAIGCVLHTQNAVPAGTDKR